MEVSGQFHNPTASPPERNLVTYWKRGWVKPIDGLDRFGEDKNTCLFRDFFFVEPRSIQIVDSRYTDYAIPAPRSWDTNRRLNLEVQVDTVNRRRGRIENTPNIFGSCRQQSTPAPVLNTAYRIRFRNHKMCDDIKCL